MDVSCAWHWAAPKPKREKMKSSENPARGCRCAWQGGDKAEGKPGGGGGDRPGCKTAQVLSAVRNSQPFEGRLKGRLLGIGLRVGNLQGVTEEGLCGL